MSWREWFGLQPREQDFVRRVLSRAQQVGEHGWVYDVESRTIKHPDHDGVLNCVNIYLEYCRAPRKFRHALIDKCVSLIQSFRLTIPDMWTLAAKSVFPAVRSRYMMTTLEINSRRTDADFGPPVSYGLDGDLRIMLMYDYGQQLATLNKEKINTWGQSEDALLTQARANLRALPKPVWVQENQVLFQLESCASYEETFLLLQEVIKLLPFNNAVLMVPNRGVLLAANRDDVDAVKVLLNRSADALLNQPWPLSGKLYCYSDGALVEMEPPATLKELAHSVELISISSVYDAQKSALEDYYQRIGEDWFVAGFNIASKKDQPQNSRSWCFWGDGIASILPKTDLIALGRNAGTAQQQTIMVPWDAVMSICADRFARSSDDPERYVVTTFVTDDEWSRLSKFNSGLN